MNQQSSMSLAKMIAKIATARSHLLAEWEQWYDSGAVDEKIGFRIQSDLNALAAAERHMHQPDEWHKEATTDDQHPT